MNAATKPPDANGLSIPPDAMPTAMAMSPGPPASASAAKGRDDGSDQVATPTTISQHSRGSWDRAPVFGRPARGETANGELVASAWRYVAVGCGEVVADRFSRSAFRAGRAAFISRRSPAPMTGSRSPKRPAP
jgi:hypothetical protein